MIKLFKRLLKPADTPNSPKPSPPDRPTLPSLDDSLYPLHWPSVDSQTLIDSTSLDRLSHLDSPHHFNSTSHLNKPHSTLVFTTPSELMTAIIKRQVAPDLSPFWQLLINDDIYQEWVNFTVFGRYIQRSFAAFYQQSEDNFNSGMPELLKHELKRHAQYLPLEQTLFVGGKLPNQARQDKLLVTTLNPFKAWADTTVLSNNSSPKSYVSNKSISNSSTPNANNAIINQITVKSSKVVGFAVRHNKRTSERWRSEVMVLEFDNLRLVNEQEIAANTHSSDNKATLDNETMLNNKTALDDSAQSVILRHYELR
ncbi:MAG: hypothetical protein Q4P13_10970 [Psychrobacter sp.]|nr:hypothetical protein [Psychrobacter sp.]